MTNKAVPWRSRDLNKWFFAMYGPLNTDDYKKTKSVRKDLVWKWIEHCARRTIIGNIMQQNTNLFAGKFIVGFGFLLHNSQAMNEQR